MEVRTLTDQTQENPDMPRLSEATHIKHYPPKIILTFLREIINSMTLSSHSKTN